MKFRSMAVALMALIVAFPLIALGETNGAQIDGRSEISYGLPQGGYSFTTVESFDSDGDGRDEIFMGGSGFDQNDVTEGILAFEYDTAMGQWQEFGSGLPGDGSGNYYGALGLGDVNGDGNIDIAAPLPTRWFLTMDETNSGVDIYTGDGTGSFSFLQRLSLTDTLGTQYHDSSNEVEIADLDGDGNSDIIVTTYVGIRVFFGDGSGTNWDESSPTHVKQTEISGVGVGDLNGDGLLDLVGTPYQRSTEVELYVQGNRRSWRDIPFEDTSAGYGVKILDLDLDGNNDVIFGTNSEGIKAYLGQGEVTINSFPHTEASTGLPSSDGPWNQIELRDINDDGLPDLIGACSSRDTVNVYLNDLPSGWTEIFTGSEELVVDGDPYGANFGDWDGDGQQDIAGCGWDDGANAWLITSGGGSSGNQAPVADAGEDQTVYIGDVVTLDGSGSDDPDGEIVEWKWECTSHPTLEITDSDSSNPSFLASEEGVYGFTLNVLDDEDEWSATSGVAVTVLDPDINYPPVAVIKGDSHGTIGDTIYLDASESSDIDGEITGWQWSCTSHSITITDPDSKRASFTPESEGDYQIELVVTDDDGDDSDPDRLTIKIDSGVSYVSPIIGPIKDSNGDPVAGATIRIEGAGGTYSKETDDTGRASFNMGVLPGDYDAFVLIDGEEVLSFSLDVKDTGQVVVDGGSYPVLDVDEGSTGDDLILIIIAVIAAVVIVSMFLFFLFRGSGKKGEQVAVAQVSAALCPRCGMQARWIPDFQRNYCDNCSDYL